MSKRHSHVASLAVSAALLAAPLDQGSRVQAQPAPAPAAPAATTPAATTPAAPTTAAPAAPQPAAPATPPPAAPAPAPRVIIPAPPPAGATAAPDKLLPAQLDALVAPIALYPDPLLSQVLVASTYPLEIVQAQQWAAQNTALKGDALLEAAQKQAWDPSVQSMVAFPDVIKRLSENISWTTDVGNAFLAQQSDVMNAVQRLRLKAKNDGKLTSSEQQTVTTKQVEQQTVVEIQPTSTQVVYVPVYNPTAVWGPPPYPYPPVYYPPPPPPGSLLITFGIGMAIGAAISHGGWGYGCGWGHSNVVVVNHHNTFIRNTDVRRGDISRQGGSSNWQHDGRHRGKVPYANPQVANRYGGSTRAPRPTQRAPGLSTGTLDRQPRPGAATGAGRGLGGDNRAGADRSGGLGGDNRAGADRSGGLGGDNRAGADRAPGPSVAPRESGAERRSPGGSFGERGGGAGGGFGDRGGGGGGGRRGAGGGGRRR